MTKPLRVVALGDLHVGSTVAVADPGSTPTNDAAAELRSRLFDRWRESAEGPWSRPDVLIVNGDIVDGQNPKGGGLGTWTNDLFHQADHAVQLLRMWRAKKIFVIRGSNYHVQAGRTGLHLEEYVARQLGAEPYPNQENVEPEARERSGWEWYLNLGGVTFHVTHKVGVARVFHYRTTPLARQMLQAKLNDQLRHEMDKNLRIRVVLRSHAHYYITVGHSGSDGWILPCWKALDEFMLSNGPLDISPDIGFVGYTIKDGKLGYEKNLWELTEVRRAPLSIVRQR